MEENRQFLKRKAEQLRTRGLSYGEIKKKLGIPKSTLSLWLKATPLKSEHRKRLYTKQIKILARGSQSQKERRKREIEAIIREATQEIARPIPQETAKLFGAALYWAEGSKGNMLQITNSDPYLILFMMQWIKKTFGIDSETLKARLNIYPQQNEKAIQRFWSDLTKIPLKNFGKSYIKPLSKGYKKNNLYYGTIRIEVPKSGNFVHRVFGWIQAVLLSETSHVETTRKRWVRLTNTARPVNLE